MLSVSVWFEFENIVEVAQRLRRKSLLKVFLINLNKFHNRVYFQTSGFVYVLIPRALPDLNGRYI